MKKFRLAPRREKLSVAEFVDHIAARVPGMHLARRDKLPKGDLFADETLVIGRLPVLPWQRRILRPAALLVLFAGAVAVLVPNIGLAAFLVGVAVLIVSLLARAWYNLEKSTIAWVLSDQHLYLFDDALGLKLALKQPVSAISCVIETKLFDRRNRPEAHSHFLMQVGETEYAIGDLPAVCFDRDAAFLAKT